MFQQRGSLLFIEGFVLGAALGAGLALVLAPKSGPETRTLIKDKGVEIKDRAKEKMIDLEHQAEEQVHLWEEKGKAAFDKQKQAFTESVEQRTPDFAQKLIHRQRENSASVASS